MSPGMVGAFLNPFPAPSPSSCLLQPGSFPSQSLWLAGGRS